MEGQIDFVSNADRIGSILTSSEFAAKFFLQLAKEIQSFQGSFMEAGNLFEI
jgi:hypothetical protein